MVADSSMRDLVQTQPSLLQISLQFVIISATFDEGVDPFFVCLLSGKYRNLSVDLDEI